MLSGEGHGGSGFGKMVLAAVFTVQLKERVKAGKISHKPRYGGEGTRLGGWQWGEHATDIPHAINQQNKTQPDMRFLWHHFPKEPSVVRVPASISKSTHLLTFAYTPQPHPILSRCLRDLGAIHMALTRKSACWSQSCHRLTPLPYANGRHEEPVSPSGYPEESLLDNLTFLWETEKGATRKHLQSPPHPPVCSEKQSCYIHY